MEIALSILALITLWVVIPTAICIAWNFIRQYYDFVHHKGFRPRAAVYAMSFPYSRRRKMQLQKALQEAYDKTKESQTEAGKTKLIEPPENLEEKMSTANKVRSAFEENGLKYKEFKELPDGSTVMIAGFDGQFTTFEMVIYFDSEDHTAMIRIPKLTKVPIDRRYDVLSTLNQLNQEYRWTRFFVDQDDEVTVQIDQILSKDQNADSVMELIVRTIKIVDEAYPKFMKAIWA